MTELPLIPISTFEKWRQESKLLVKNSSIPLNDAQHITANKYGFGTWTKLKARHNQFLEKLKPYQDAKIIFVDVADAGDIDLQDSQISLIRDEYATFYCDQLLYKKRLIRECYQSRKDDLVGFRYSGVAISNKQLYEECIDAFFLEPGYVFMDGCFLMFNELKELSQNPKQIIKAEFNLVDYDHLEPYCFKHHQYSSALFDLNGHINVELPISVGHFRSVGWDAQKVINMIIDMRIDHVILYDPPEGMADGVMLVTGKQMLDVVYPVRKAR